MTYVMVFEDITPRHPACRKIAKATGIDPLAAFGALVSFWQWADKLTEDGFIPSTDESDVDYAVGLPGFAKALSEYGSDSPWLTFDARGLRIHNYNARGGTSTKQRHKDRVRRALAREDSPPEQPSPDSVREKADKPRTNRGQKPATSFDRESDREIDTDSPNGESCPEPAAPASEPPPQPQSKAKKPAELTEWVFPTVGKQSSWALPRSKLDEYRDAFPHLDLAMELRTARQWCNDNAAKRKTPGGMPAFLFRWLSRAQNSGPKNGPQQRTFAAISDRTGPSRQFNPDHEVDAAAWGVREPSAG